LKKGIARKIKDKLCCLFGTEDFHHLGLKFNLPMKHRQNINVVGDVHAAGEHLNSSLKILNKQRGTLCAEHRNMESIIWKLHFDWILFQHRRPPERPHLGPIDMIVCTLQEGS